MIYMPKKEYTAIINQITKNHKCYLYDAGDYYCQCKSVYDSGYPDIVLDIGKIKLTLQSKWYLMKLNYTGSNPDCFIGISLDESLADNYWILGDTFLRAYLTIYDKTNNQIGFIGEVDPGELAANAGSLSKTTKIIIISVSVPVTVIILVISFVVMLKCCGAKK